MREQIAAVQCSDMLIGIHGAGLEHNRFMKKGAFLIQLGWPHWEANFLYDIPPKWRGVRAQKVQDACEPVISEEGWSLYFKHNPELRGLMKEEIYALAEHLWVKSFRENIWKYANCVLNVTRITEIVGGCIEKRKKREIEKIGVVRLNG